MAFFKRQLLLLLAAAQVFAGDDLLLVLYDNENGCGGISGVCADASFGQCCYKPGYLWGSGSADGGNRPGMASLLAPQGGLYCRIALTPPKKIPICLNHGFPSIVGGIYPVRSLSDTDDEMADVEVTAAVEAELAFTTDTHHYIISDAKMSTLSEPVPKGAVAREAFFRKHADKVLERRDAKEVLATQGEL